MKAKSFLILVFLSSTAYAEVPDNLLSSKKFRDEIQLSLKNKILQMNQNFVSTIYGQTARYTSPNSVRCKSQVTVSPNDTILEITKTSKNSESYVKEIKNYIGCSKKISFREETFSNPERESYELTGPDNVRMFKYLKIVKQNRTTTTFSIAGKDFARMVETQRDNYSTVHYHFTSRSVLLKVFNSMMSFNTSEKSTSHYWAKIYKTGFIEYYADDYQQISLATFLKNVNLEGINRIVGTLLYDLPETKFLKSGNSNAKLVNELRNAQTFLLSNTNIDYVKNLIDEYIKAAESGDISDNREQ